MEKTTDGHGGKAHYLCPYCKKGRYSGVGGWEKAIEHIQTHKNKVAYVVPRKYDLDIHSRLSKL